jgi:hypothetical protein
LSISSGIEKNLNFIDDADNELNMARINLEDGHTCPSTVQGVGRAYVDDLRNLSPFNMADSVGSSNIERLLKHHHMRNGKVNDKFSTNSDHSLTSGMSSNLSASPNKRLVDVQNFSQISQNGITSFTFNNNLFNDSRRGSHEYTPDMLIAMRDLVRGGSFTKSARNSKDFTNIAYASGIFGNNNVLDEKYLLDNLLLLLKDQNGCRLIQKKIEEKPEYIYTMFDKMQTSLIDIINDQFGNYVIQKIIDYIYNDKPVVTKFFETIKRQLFKISVHPCGTRVLQRLLDYFCTSYTNVVSQVTNEAFRGLLANHAYELIMDTNGNHVFQKILIIYPTDSNQFIYDELMRLSCDIARSKKGGCVLQRAFDHASPSQLVKD